MLGERLKTLRGKRTQEDIAKYLGISRARYSHYENERSEPDIENLQKLAELYNTTTDYLLGRTNNPSPDNSNISVAFYDGLEGFEELDPEQQRVIMDTVEDMVARFKKRKQELEAKKNK